MALFLPQTRTQRPPGRAELLSSHPLHQALCFASVADSAQAFDLISRNAAPMVSADSYVPSPMGPSWKYTANSTNSGSSFGVFNPITTSDGAGGGDFTILAFGNPTAAAGIACLIDQRKGAASNEQIGLFANSNKSLSASSGLMSLVTASTAGVTQGCQSVAGVVDGFPHVYAGRRSGTAHSIWSDGVDRTNTSDVSANTVWSVNQALEIGAAAALTSATFGANCNIVLCLAWNRALSDAEMLSVGRNPWQLFKALQPRIYSASPVSGTPTNITLGQASWVWTGFAPTVNAQTGIAMAQAAWAWAGRAASVNAQTGITLARATWQWFGIPLQGAASTAYQNLMLFFGIEP